MTTPRYRIGNDLSVFWAIHNRDGSPFDMEGMEVHLYMTNERGRKEVDAVLSSLDDGTINNVIRWDYAGEDQRVLGLHSLTVEILESNSHREIVKDYCEAFELVSRSNEETEEGDANVSVRGDLILSSKLDIYRFEAASVEVGDLKEDIKEITDSLQDINESIKGIGEESIEIKATINGIQKEVNEIGTELSTKASVNSVIEIGEQITEVQENVAEQTIKVDGLSAEISTKASADSVTQIAGDLAITNKTLAEQSLKVTDLETEISTKASADSVTEIGEGLKTTAASLAEQVTKVTALESEISTKASSESVTQLASGLNLTNQTVAEQITRTDGIEASIENLVTKETFNAATGEIANEFTSIKQTTDSIETTIQSQSGEIASIKGGVSGLSVEIGKVQTDLDSLRDQLDGVTESYFYDYSPSNTNEPAKTWIENGTEASHKGDTFTNTALEGEGAGKSWRWLQASDGSWSWHPIADTDAQKALLLASQAQAAADGKVTIFYQLPDKYKVGDIWFVHSDEYHPYKKGEILSASETSAIFNLGHWESKTRYSKAVDDLNETMNTTFRDGVLDDAERKAIKDNLNNLYKDKQSVDGRYNTIVANADFNDTTLKNEFKAVKASYDSAYNSLVTIVEQIIAASTEGLKTLFASYKNLMKTYREAYAAYNTKETEVTEALMGRLNHASRYLDNITNDGVLTPIEKEQLYEIYRGIAKEYAATRNNAFNYKIWAYTIDGVTEQAGNNGGSGRYELYLEFKRAYTPIVSAFNSSVWGFDKMDETTNLPSGYTTTQLKEYLDAYYSAQGTLTEVFSAITASIDEAQKKAEKTLNELTGVLSPEEMLTQVGKGVVLSTIIATKDTAGNITAAMNASNAYKDNSEDNHGRIIIAGGVKDIEDWNNANFVLYEDGHADLRSVNVSGYASITKLELGLKEKVDVRDYEQLLQAVNDLSSLFSPVYDNNGELVLIKANASFMARGYAAGATATVEEGGGGAILNKDSIISALGYTPYDATNPSGYITESALIGYATTDALANGLSAKQDTITDLATIRSNAKNGATAYGWGNHANAGYATTEYVDTKIAYLINGAPTTLDTLKEIADALAENEDVVDALEAAIGTKANASDLTALAGRVTTAEGNIVTLTNGKADKASTLAGYGITDAYTKGDIDGKITSINGVLTTHDNRLKSLEDMWYLENGVVKSKYPMMTKGYAAGATASVSSGEGGVVLNKESIIEALGYTPYDAINPSGYITASALNGYATQSWVEGKGYQLSSGLGSLAYKNTVAWPEITNKMKAGNEFNFIPSGFNYSVVHFNYRCDDGSASTTPISQYEFWDGQLGGYASLVGKSFIVNGGTSSQFLKADGSVDSTAYLPTSGGTLKGVLILDSSLGAYSFLRFTDGRIGSLGYADNILQITDAEGGIHGALGLYGNSNGVTYYYLGCEDDAYNGNNFRVYADKVTFGDNTLLHSGNVGDYALPISGGTISGPLTINTFYDRSLVLDEPGGEQYHIISFAAGGEEYATLRANNLGTTNQLEFNGNIVVHTGNIGLYRSGNSLMLDGMSPTSYLRYGDVLTSNVDANELRGMTFHPNTTSNGSGNTNMPIGYGYLLNLSNNAASDISYYKGVQISFGSGDVLQFRRHWACAWQPWKTILHSDNVGEYALKIDGSNKMSKGVLFSDRTLTESYTRGTGIEMFMISEGGSASPTGSVYFSTLHAVSSYAGLQLAVFGGGNDNSLYYRKIGELNTWSDWKTIAFTDSTVAAANKLVDDSGSARVTLDSDGQMIVGGAGMSIGGFSEFGNIIYANAYGNGRSKYAAILINKGGDRFGIGPSSTNTSDISFGVTSDILGTWKSEFLTFNTSGIASFVSNIQLNNNKSLTTKDTDGFARQVLYMNIYNSLVLGAEVHGLGDSIFGGTNVYLRYGNSPTVGVILNSSGNVGIGTTSPAYKLDVAGTGRFSGAVTMASTLTVGGHIAVTSTGNSYSGLYPNKSITDDDNDTRLWLYNAGELALYGSSIVMRSAVKMTNYLTVAGSAFFSSTHFNGYAFFNSGGEGIYISNTGQSINWHDADNAHVRTMMEFASDSITMHRNILPSADKTYNLGDASLRWRNMCVSSIDTNNINASEYVYSEGYIHSDEYISTDGDVRASGFLQTASGIKIGDATITWDAANGVLKINKPIMATGYVAGATATAN